MRKDVQYWIYCEVCSLKAQMRPRNGDLNNYHSWRIEKKIEPTMEFWKNLRMNEI